MKTFVFLVVLGIIGYVCYAAWTGMAATGIGQKLDKNEQTLKEVDK
jgi:hypothetical protein